MTEEENTVVDLKSIASLRIHMAEMHEALEHVTELLVDTWADKMECDPEREIAVVNARKILTQPLDQRS